MPRPPRSQSKDIQPALDLETLLDIKALMRYLGVSRPTIYALMADAGLPAIRMGRQLRFRPSSVARWIATQEQTE